MTIEQKIKKQFSKIFDQSDNVPFKQTGDYYFKVAATLKKKNIEVSNGLKLWFRNVQKRLYIGIATELILKALYLKNDFNINRPNRKIKITFPEKINNLNNADLNPSDTYSLSQLIDKLDSIIVKPSDYKKIMEGLRICKVFRNKEGHVAVHWHKFDQADYEKIEYSIKRIYEIGFSENLEFKISMTKVHGAGKFEIKQVRTTTKPIPNKGFIGKLKVNAIK